MEELAPGDPGVVGGYRLLRRLGSGGMGVVYVGRDSGGRTAALKVIRREFAGDAEFRRRFAREVRAVQGVSHPGLVRIEAADTEAEQPWYATEFVAAPSLSDVVMRHGPLPAGAWAVLGSRLSAALHAVHEAGLVHRDVKPANVLLSLSGPRLIDFGIARGHHDSVLTGFNRVVGTVGYMAPEYLTTGYVDERGDLFAFGAVLACAATGRHPFGTGPAEAVQYRSIHEQPDLLGLDADRADLVGALLAKNPYARPPLEAVHRQLHTPAPDQGAWLPAPVLADVAAMAASLLRLRAAPEPVAVPEPRVEQVRTPTAKDDRPTPSAVLCPPSEVPTLFRRLKAAFNAETPVTGQKLHISATTARNGGTVTVTVPRTATCPVCNGVGGLGRGRNCSRCEGGGSVTTSAEVAVQLPAGLTHGSWLKVSDVGAATADGRRMNLYLQVDIGPDPSMA